MNNLLNTELDYQDLVSKYGSPLLILDKATVRHQYRSLRDALPGVTLHYALKPLPQDAVIDVLEEEGACFDLASNGEVDIMREHGINPAKCIHTHPIKKPSDISYALDYGCRVFVADNVCELEKLAEFKDQVKVLIRVSFPNPETKVDLSKKFGALPEEVLPLLEKARDLGIEIYGLSFHVGSQVKTAKRHVEAVTACADIIREAAAKGIAINVLDIGGGFPVDYDNAGETDIREFCKPIVAALANVPEGVRIIAEPGRFISAPCMIGICSVTGKSMRFGKPWYYLDDGVYCSYSGQIFDHVVYPKYTQKTGAIACSVLAGPTCDSIDIIAEDIPLPELEVGDLVIGKMMGAYTIATATNFNFIPQAKIVEIDLEREALSINFPMVA